eukprot:4097320-Prymnesium_polylepis.1
MYLHAQTHTGSVNRSCNRYAACHTLQVHPSPYPTSGTPPLPPPSSRDCTLAALNHPDQSPPLRPQRCARRLSARQGSR